MLQKDAVKTTVMEDTLAATASDREYFDIKSKLTHVYMSDR